MPGHLTDDVWQQCVMTHLGPLALCRLAATARQMRALASADELWRPLVNARWPKLNVPPRARRPDAKPWQAVYADLCQGKYRVLYGWGFPNAFPGLSRVLAHWRQLVDADPHVGVRVPYPLRLKSLPPTAENDYPVQVFSGKRFIGIVMNSGAVVVCGCVRRELGCRWDELTLVPSPVDWPRARIKKVASLPETVLGLAKVDDDDGCHRSVLVLWQAWDSGRVVRDQAGIVFPRGVHPDAQIRDIYIMPSTTCPHRFLAFVDAPSDGGGLVSQSQLWVYYPPVIGTLDRLERLKELPGESHIVEMYGDMKGLRADCFSGLEGVHPWSVSSSVVTSQPMRPRCSLSPQSMSFNEVATPGCTKTGERPIPGHFRALCPSQRLNGYLNHEGELYVDKDRYNHRSQPLADSFVAQCDVDGRLQPSDPLVPAKSPHSSGSAISHSAGHVQSEDCIIALLRRLTPRTPEEAFFGRGVAPLYFDRDINMSTGRPKHSWELSRASGVGTSSTGDCYDCYGGSYVLDASLMGGQGIALVIELPPEAYEQEPRVAAA